MTVRGLDNLHYMLLALGMFTAGAASFFYAHDHWHIAYFLMWAALIVVLLAGVVMQQLASRWALLAARINARIEGRR